MRLSDVHFDLRCAALAAEGSVVGDERSAPMTMMIHVLTLRERSQDGNR
jgi:hypothetical protein